jgi:hypothetical protein
LDEGWVDDDDGVAVWMSMGSGGGRRAALKGKSSFRIVFLVSLMKNVKEGAVIRWIKRPILREICDSSGHH